MSRSNSSTRTTPPRPVSRWWTGPPRAAEGDTSVRLALDTLQGRSHVRSGDVGTKLAHPTPVTTPHRREVAISYRRTFNRFEFKYLVSHRQYHRLRAELAHFVRPDAHGEHDAGYRVFSVYWDSPARRFFWEKIEGVGFRRKLRFRRYGSDEQTYIEIKQRMGRTVQKRRIRWDLDRVVDAFWNPARPPTVPPGGTEDPFAAEIYYLVARFQLRPEIAVSYRRQALYGRYDPDLRITFDTRVQYEPRRTDIARPFDVGKYVVDPRLTVMEVKFNDRVPRWFGKIARANQLAMVRLSKFCTAVDREYYGGVLT